MKKQRKVSSGINIGTSSLLLVFVILCLVSFATLSIVSANADKKLNDKVVQRSQGYYNACSEANNKLMTIDQTLRTVYDTGVTRDEFLEQVGTSFSFGIEVSDMQTLYVEATVNYPSADGDPFYKITSWNLETTGSLEIDESLHLMNFE